MEHPFSHETSLGAGIVNAELVPVLAFVEIQFARPPAILAVYRTTSDGEEKATLAQ